MWANGSLRSMLAASASLSGSRVKVSTVTKQHAWKTPTPACVGWIKDQDRAGRTATACRQDGQLVGCIKAFVVLSQIQAVAGQPTYCLSQYEWYALFFLLGLFFRPSPLSFRQVDQHAIACCPLINAVGNGRSGWVCVPHATIAPHNCYVTVGASPCLQTSRPIRIAIQVAWPLWATVGITGWHGCDLCRKSLDGLYVTFSRLRHVSRCFFHRVLDLPPVQRQVDRWSYCRAIKLGICLAKRLRF